MGVNAPLTSPDDLVANAGSVAVVSLLGAIIAGMIWARIKGDVQSRSRTFNIVLTVLLLLTVGSAAAIEYGADITNAIRYIVPLGAIVTIFVSVLTPVIERWKAQTVLMVIAAALPLVMLVLGYFLTVNEFGFTEAAQFVVAAASQIGLIASPIGGLPSLEGANSKIYRYDVSLESVVGICVDIS